MRQSIRELVELVAGILAKTAGDRPPTVHEFGALQVAGQEGFSDLRCLFGGVDYGRGVTYTGSDLRLGPGVDMIIDLHLVNRALVPKCSLGVALVLDTLEHVRFPQQAVREVFESVHERGLALFTSTMSHPIHAYPHDYWRFTPEGFDVLMSDFDIARFTGCAGVHYDRTPEIVFSLCCKWPTDEDIRTMTVIQRVIEGTWLHRWKHRTDHSGPRWRAFVKDLLPPVITRRLMERERRREAVERGDETETKKDIA